MAKISEEKQKELKKKKELRAEQIKAAMFGATKEMQEEWERTIKRFYENRAIAEEEFTYTDNNGETYHVQYETIKDYAEYKNDEFFLNLEDYKNYLELTTRYRASKNNPYSLTPEMIQAYEKAEAKEPGSGKQKIEAMIQDMEEYVETFNGIATRNAMYAMKGAVTVANQEAGRTRIRKYPNNKIRNSLPTPFKTTKTEKEVARREYYHTHDKNNRFVAWFKAKSDKYIFRGRKYKTEQAIVQARIAESNKAIEKRENPQETVERNARVATANQVTREQPYKKEEVKSTSAEQRSDFIKSLRNNNSKKKRGKIPKKKEKTKKFCKN